MRRREGMSDGDLYCEERGVYYAITASPSLDVPSDQSTGPMQGYGKHGSRSRSGVSYDRLCRLTARSLVGKISEPNYLETATVNFRKSVTLPP